MRAPRWLRRLRDLRHARRLERELDEELRFHLDKEIEHNLGQGMAPGEARRQALQRFGGVEQTKEQLRDHHGLGLAGELAKDVRYGLRMLRKSPGFTAVAVLSLALGIGANTALFSVAESLLLSTLPVTEPERLVLFEWEAGLDFRNSGISGWSSRDPDRKRRGSSSFHHRQYDQMRSARDVVSDVVAFAGMSANLTFEGQSEVASGQFVSGSYFSVLGVRAQIGRTLTEADDRAGAPPAAVVSDRYWQAQLGADPAAVGKKLAINGVPFTIVGVLPAGFTGTMQVDTRPAVMVPLAIEALIDPGRNNSAVDQRDAGRRRDWWLNLMGRLQPGVTVQQVQARLNGPFQALALEMMPPPTRENQPARLEASEAPVLLVSPGGWGMLENRRGYATTLRWLFGALGLVLLIACANVANMLLARSSARATEITLRVTLGAGRFRLVRQLLTESLLVAALGGTLGIGLAVAGQRLLVAVAEDQGGLFPAEVSYGISGRLLCFTLSLSVVTAVLFGLVPALRATRVDLVSALKQGGRGAVRSARSRLSQALVVAQVAMSLVLLLGAGLFLRTVHNLQGVDLGFNQQNLTLFTLRPADLAYDAARRENLYGRLFARLEALPGVSSATFASLPLISGAGSKGLVILPGETARTPAEHPVDRLIIRENYLDALEIPLVRGRRFTAADRAGAPRVAIVNQTFARRYFPGGDALGQQIAYAGRSAEKMEIVGIAGDTKYDRQRRDTSPLAYTTWRQDVGRSGQMTFAVRASGPSAALVPVISRVVQEIDPNLPMTAVGTQVERSERTIAAERFTAKLLTFFGALAALLAGIGLYGVMAYSVSQRTAEIGIRMALGARAGAVVRLVAGQALVFVAAGVVMGLLGAQGLQGVVASQLYGVTAADPVTILLVIAGVLLLCLLACWVPARRATRVDPMVALRSE